MSDHLPPEVLTSIFLRLPLKTLVQCTSVCKTWYALLTSQTFITTHRTHHNKTHLLLRQQSLSDRIERYSLRSDSESLDLLQPLHFPFQSLNKCFRILGSCNGLLCLSDDAISYTDVIILWNPSIQKFMTLPRPRVTFVTHGSHMHALGFGYDSRTNDYKVVRITFLQGNGGCGWIVPPEVDVYSLSTGSWRQIASATAPPYQVLEIPKSQAYINGAIHWIAYNGNCNLIMSFDMSDEVFGELMLPTSLARGEPLWDSCIAVLGESLSVFSFSGCRGCDIWVMKDYGVAESWTKQFVVRLEGGLRMVLGLRKNGEFLLASKDGELVSYNPEMNNSKKLGIHGNSHSLYLGTYTESLVLLKAVNGAPIVNGKNRIVVE